MRFFCVEHRFEAGDFAADGAELAGLFELAALLLDAKVKAFLAQLVLAAPRVRAALNSRISLIFI